MWGYVSYPRWQVLFLRRCLGGYFLYFFLGTSPFLEELFLQDQWFPYHLPLPWSFAWMAHGNSVYGVYVVGGAASVCIFLNFFSGWAGALVWMALAILVTRNPSIFDFNLAYLGWLLLAQAFFQSKEESSSYFLPRAAHFGAWLILSLTYSWSGWSKAHFDMWTTSGDAVAYVLSHKVARFPLPVSLVTSHWIALFLQILTWSVLVLELLFAPLSCFARTRFWVWLGMLLVQAGIFFLTTLSEINLAAALFHFFVADPRWFQPFCSIRLKVFRKFLGCTESVHV